MTIQQRKYFFELVTQLNLNKEEAITHALEKSGQTDFNQITTAQLDPMIKAMEAMREEASQSTPEETPKGDFPALFRIWDKMMREMSYDDFALDELVAVSLEFEDKNRFHVMQWTGRLDDTDKRIFDFDFITSTTGKKYLIQWDWKNCCWAGYDEDNNSISLGSFGKLTVVGNVYSEVKPV